MPLDFPEAACYDEKQKTWTREADFLFGLKRGTSSAESVLSDEDSMLPPSECAAALWGEPYRELNRPLQRFLRVVFSERKNGIWVESWSVCFIPVFVRGWGFF